MQQEKEETLKTKIISKKVLALLCGLSIVLTSVSFPLSSKADGDSVTYFRDSKYAYWEQVTFSHYTPLGEVSNVEDGYYGECFAAFAGGMASKVFHGNVKFRFDSYSTITLGTPYDEVGFSLTTKEGQLYLNILGKDPILVDPDIAGTQLIGQEWNLKVSYDLLENNTLRLGLWMNNKLYDNQYIEVADYDEVLLTSGMVLYGMDVSSAEKEKPTPAFFVDSAYADWEQITFADFGLDADTDIGTTYTGTDANGFAAIGYFGGDSLAGKVFNGNITLSEVSSYVIIGGLNDAWEGIYLVSNPETGQLEINGYGPISIEEAVPGEQFNLKLSYEMIENSGITSLKLGIWINNQLHENGYITYTDYTSKVGPYMSFYTPYKGSYVTVSSKIDTGDEETNERYNLADGPYLISGTGTILVNGEEYPNGATLTEPGIYRIVSDDGNFVRNVELYDAGKKSTALSYGENVMPIVGFYGPHSNDYGNSVTDNVYELVEEAGINLINYIPKTWSNKSHQSEILRNLRYAEAHNIGLYVGGGSFSESNLTAEVIAETIAPYSQYDSFKGIFVADEPGVQNLYYPTSNGVQDPGWSELWLDGCAKLAKAVNQYCNLNGYINLFPYVDYYAVNQNADDYRQYMEEYITETEARVLSYDNYVFDQMDMANYFENLSLAREKSLQHNVPFWPYVQAGNWRAPSILSGDVPTQGQFLWNVNTSLAYGAKGIQYYTLIMPEYVGEEDNKFGLIDKDGNPTAWYPYAQRANRQIAAVDEVLMQAESKAVLAIGKKAQADTGITATSYGKLSSVTLGHEEEEGGIRFKDSAYADWEQVTFSDYGIQNGAYAAKEASYSSGLKNKVFNGNVKFSSGYGEILIGSNWLETGLLIYGEEGKLYLPALGTEPLDPEIAGTPLIGEEFNLKLSFEMVSSGWLNSTLKLGVWINDKLYNGQYIEITDFWINLLSDLRISGAAEGAVTVSSPAESVLIGAFAHLDKEAFYVVNYDTASQQRITLNFEHSYKYRLIQDGVTTYGQGNVCTLKIPAGEAVLVELYCGVELQMEITDSIAMRYMATIENAQETPTMTFVMEGNSTPLVVEGIKVDGTDYTYQFVYAGIKPQDMAKTVTAILKLGEDTIQTYEHSVLDYCRKLLEVEDASTLLGSNGASYTDVQLAALKELVVDLVEYGAQVQTYGASRGQLDEVEEADLLTTILGNAISGYTAYDKVSDTQMGDLTGVVTAKLSGTASSQDALYRWTGAALVFKDKINIRAKFKLLDAADVNDFRMMVSVNNSTAKAYEFTAVSLGNNSEFYVDFSDIYADEFSKTISITFYQGDEQVGQTLNYSVNTYLEAKRNTNDTDLQNLLLAIHGYGNASLAFKSSMM